MANSPEPEYRHIRTDTIKLESGKTLELVCIQHGLNSEPHDDVLRELEQHVELKSKGRGVPLVLTESKPPFYVGFRNVHPETSKWIVNKAGVIPDPFKDFGIFERAIGKEGADAKRRLDAQRRALENMGRLRPLRNADEMELLMRKFNGDNQPEGRLLRLLRDAVSAATAIGIERKSATWADGQPVFLISRRAHFRQLQKLLGKSVLRDRFIRRFTPEIQEYILSTP